MLTHRLAEEAAVRNPDKMVEAGAWALEHGHRTMLKLTGGRWPKRIMGMQPVELHTTGRRSGQRRSTMLTAPICEPDRVIVVASKGGHSDHPDWYKNLVANPEVEITVARRRSRCTPAPPRRARRLTCGPCSSPPTRATTSISATVLHLDEADSRGSLERRDVLVDES